MFDNDMYMNSQLSRKGIGTNEKILVLFIILPEESKDSKDGSKRGERRSAMMIPINQPEKKKKKKENIGPRPLYPTPIPHLQPTNHPTKQKTSDVLLCGENNCFQTRKDRQPPSHPPENMLPRYSVLLLKTPIGRVHIGGEKAVNHIWDLLVSNPIHARLPPTMSCPDELGNLLSFFKRPQSCQHPSSCPSPPRLFQLLPPDP